MKKIIVILFFPYAAFCQQTLNKVKIISPRDVIFSGKDAKVEIHTTIEESPEKSKIYMVGAESRDSGIYEILTYRFGNYSTLKISGIDVKIDAGADILNERYSVVGKSISPFIVMGLPRRKITFQAVELSRDSKDKYFFEIVFTLLKNSSHNFRLEGVESALIQPNNISGL